MLFEEYIKNESPSEAKEEEYPIVSPFGELVFGLERKLLKGKDLSSRAKTNPGNLDDEKSALALGNGYGVPRIRRRGTLPPPHLTHTASNAEDILEEEVL